MKGITQGRSHLPATVVIKDLSASAVCRYMKQPKQKRSHLPAKEVSKHSPTQIVLKGHVIRNKQLVFLGKVALEANDFSPV